MSAGSHHPLWENRPGTLQQSDLSFSRSEYSPIAAGAPHPLSATDAMPVELWREIFRHTSPANHRGVIDLSAVNRFWRRIALDLSELFTYANWNEWPLEALKEWAERGEKAGLEVALGQEGVRRALASDDFVHLLDDTSHSWYALSMEFDRAEDRNVRKLLPRWECLNLRSLVLVDLDDEGQYEVFDVMEGMAPNLEELVCKDIHVVRPTPWRNLKLVSINVDFWLGGDDRTNIFRTISQAENLVFDGCGFSGIGGANIVLDVVKLVTIVDDSATAFAEWPLRHLSFPNADRLILRGTRPYIHEFPDADKQLWVRTGAFQSVIVPPVDKRRLYKSNLLE
jgi:sulfur transfer complex TusBCD TusB component (DsrH family)